MSVQALFVEPTVELKEWIIKNQGAFTTEEISKNEIGLMQEIDESVHIPQ